MNIRISGWFRLLALNALLTTLLLVVAFAGLEAYLRWSLPASSGGSIFTYTLASKRYKVMRPDARIVAWGSEFRTNRLGFRDRKSEVAPKRPGEFRIIVLGDSFTVSAGVDYDRIYTSLLEQRLARRFPGTTVLNLAVGGYNIVQYRLVFEEVGRGLEPDLVVVAVFPFNDLSNDTYRGNYQAASGAAGPNRASWYRNLYVYQVYLSKAESRVRAWLGPHEVHAHAAASDNGRQENLSALRAIFEFAAAHGIEAEAVLLPNTDVLRPQRAQFAPFEAFCHDGHYRCVNLLSGFLERGVDGTAFRLNPLDAHPNEAYNTLVADLLEQPLSSLIEARRGRQAAAQPSEGGQ